MNNFFKILPGAFILICLSFVFNTHILYIRSTGDYAIEKILKGFGLTVFIGTTISLLLEWLFSYLGKRDYNFKNVISFYIVFICLFLLKKILLDW